MGKSIMIRQNGLFQSLLGPERSLREPTVCQEHVFSSKEVQGNDSQFLTCWVFFSCLQPQLHLSDGRISPCFTEGGRAVRPA